MSIHETPLLSVVNVEKWFGDFAALRDVSLTIGSGSVTCIVGPSGSGKSTLLRTLNMLEQIDAGAIFLNEELIGQVPSKRGRMRASVSKMRKQTLNFGMVFQHFNLFPNLTAIDNVSLALVKVAKVGRTSARGTARDLLARVGLGDKVDSYPKELSGGQQQRVAIARALALDPKVLLFDEPTSALDPELVGEVLSVIQGLAEQGATMVIVTHEMSFARRVADRIIMMDEGRIVESGKPQDILDAPSSDRARQFFGAVGV